MKEKDLFRNISAEGKGIYLSIMPSVLGLTRLLNTAALLASRPPDPAPPDPVGKILELTQVWIQEGLGTEGLALVAVGLVAMTGVLWGISSLFRALLKKLLFSGYYKNTQL